MSRARSDEKAGVHFFLSALEILAGRRLIDLFMSASGQGRHSKSRAFEPDALNPWGYFMSPIARLIVASAAIAATFTGIASAQDYSLAPTYGTVALASGFSPDPYAVSVQSGGSIDSSSSIGGACRGFVASAPDVRLNFTAGSLPLIISSGSSADTTLVVNAPDGRWYCDDDSGQAGMNPMVRFNTPASGQYDIWIGTYGSSSLQPAQLHISELYSQ